MRLWDFFSPTLRSGISNLQSFPCLICDVVFKPASSGCDDFENGFERLSELVLAIGESSVREKDSFRHLYQCRRGGGKLLQEEG